ncbi:MAG TPA: diacylglycerol kinase family protein [Kofleriaceae bacterium]|nr:diacylglycerol kinase family protein [Kofleriaceae bacterium]
MAEERAGLGVDAWRGGRPAVLFGNPTAQSGRGRAAIERASALLEAAGVEHRFVATAPEGGTVALVRDAIDVDGARVVIAMGGDGTFAEVAKGILGSAHAPSVAMGLLPTGTANDQAKSFGMSAGEGALPANVETIAAGSVAPIDAGRIEVSDRAEQLLHRDLFFDSASIGFGAAALATRNRDRELVGRVPLLGLVYRDMAVYAGAVARRFLESYVADVKFDLEAEIDGRPYHFDSLLDVIVKNTRVFGGEWILDPDARADDGKFELVPIMGRRDLTSKLFASLRHLPIDGDTLRTLGIEHSEPIPGRRFVLTVTHPGRGGLPAAQIDGEEIEHGHRYRIEVLPRCLHLIVPRRRRTDPAA